MKIFHHLTVKILFFQRFCYIKHNCEKKATSKQHQTLINLFKLKRVYSLKTFSIFWMYECMCVFVCVVYFNVLILAFCNNNNNIAQLLAYIYRHIFFIILLFLILRQIMCMYVCTIMKKKCIKRFSYLL